jgi:hypothetical protein
LVPPWFQHTQGRRGEVARDHHEQSQLQDEQEDGQEIDQEFENVKSPPNSIVLPRSLRSLALDYEMILDSTY